MKRSKRLLALLLSTVCVATLAAGCSGGGESSTPSGGGSDGGDSSDEHMTITIGYWDADSALGSRDTDKVLQTIEEELNVTFEPVNVTWDDYNQKFQLWASSDTLPDIFAADTRTTATFAQWANDGLLHEIPSDLSAYPNL